MISRHNLPSAYVGVICENIALFALVCAVALGRTAAAQVPPPEIVRWEIEATVVDIVDPAGYFPDVRLGDPVRGTLKYDLTLLPNPFYSRPPRLYDYTNETWMDVATMVIENPRTGNEMPFVKDVAGESADVDVVNNWVLDGEESDWLSAFQSVLPPVGFTGTAPIVEVILDGPPTTISDTILPSTLDLNDWPIAAISFRDLYAGDVFGTYIDAEIYSLTPITTPPLPGDFNFDGNVDEGDYYGWKASFGSTGVLYADGNGNGIVDAADYTVWRDHLGVPIGAGNGAITSGTIPEPKSMVLLIVGMLTMCSRRRPTV